MSPPPEFVVWLVDLDRDGDAFARQAYERQVLDPSEQRRLVAYTRAADARAFAATRAALHQLLREPDSRQPVNLRTGRTGKPFAPDLPAFSLSHTATHAAIAINPMGGVGVDIEGIRDVPPGQVAIDSIAPLVSDLWPEHRLRIAAWTVAEAWVKLHGRTLAELLDSPGRLRGLLGALQRDGDTTRLTPLGLPAGLVGACWTTGPARPVIRQLAPAERNHTTVRSRDPLRPQAYPKALA